MPDFSVILQNPEVRSIVQDGILERAFHDALYAKALFRGEATPIPWPEGIGDSIIHSAPGLIPINAAPSVPGDDPVPQTYALEQWTAQLQQYTGTIDTHMPTNYTAIINLFLRNAHQLGLQACSTTNRIARNRMYNAALSGWTVADGAQTTTTTLRVKRLNGLTRARNPTLSGASKVKFDYVSSTNPLSVRIYDNTGPAEVQRNIIGFTPDTAGDEVGPGTVTLSAAVTVLDRAYVITDDRTYLVRVGGGNKVDDLTPGTDTPKLADVRNIVSNMWQQNVPAHADGRFHAHASPISLGLLFNDTEFRQLFTSLPDYFVYKDFAIGELLNCVFFRNSESPTPDTVVNGSSATYTTADPFPGELTNNGAASSGGAPKVQRILFTAQDGIMEYFADQSKLITEAGVTGFTADPRITNNGIEVFVDRVQFIVRAPLNRLQDQVATTWRFLGDWPLRTDAATGSAARYKRFGCIEHSE